MKTNQVHKIITSCFKDTDIYIYHSYDLVNIGFHGHDYYLPNNDRITFAIYTTLDVQYFWLREL